MEAQLSFLPQTPAVDRRTPREPIARTALIEGQYRRWLRRRWGAGPTIGWVMLNPSTADHARDDPTLLRIMGFSLRWGYGGLVVVNLYPFISASPRACRRWLQSFRCDIAEPDWSARDAYIRNHSDCAQALADCDLVMAAWGAGADPDDIAMWMDQVGAELGAIDLHCLGRNADGSPKHPLARGVHRVPDDQRPMLWRPL